PASVVSHFFFSSRRRHTRFSRDWSSDVCSSDLWDGRYRASVPGTESSHKFTLFTPPACARRRNVHQSCRYRQVHTQPTFANYRRSEERRVGNEAKQRSFPEPGQYSEQYIVTGDC